MQPGNVVKPTTSETLETRFHGVLAARFTRNYAMSSLQWITKKPVGELSK